MIIGEIALAFASLIYVMVLCVGLMVELIVTGMSLLLELLFWLIAYRSVKSKSDEERVEAVKQLKSVSLTRSKWAKRVAIVSGIALVCTVGFVLILNTFFFEPTARMLINAAATKAGATVTFNQADGNLFTGRIELQDVTIIRQQHSTTNVDLHADTLILDLNLTAMAWGKKNVEFAEANNLTGTVDRVGAGPKQPWFSRPNIVIDELLINDVDITFNDHTRNNPVTLDLLIDHWRSEPIYSRWFVFNMLFHTNARGSINGANFELDSNHSPTQGQANWAFRKVPADLAGLVIGGPLTLLDAGEVDIDIKNRWGTNSRLVMDWAFTLRDPHATTPSHLTGSMKKLADTTVTFINKQEEDIKLAFTLDHDQNDFKGTASVQATGLVKNVAESLVEELKKSAVAAMAGGAEKVQEGADKVKSYFKERFKRDEGENSEESEPESGSTE